MSQKLKFKKGEFITQNSCQHSFAIFEGKAYDPIKEGEGVDYSLICYHNPNHFTQDSKGNWIRENIFEYDLDGFETCEYTINEDDMKYWRSCTQTEIDEALRILAKKRLAWIEETHKFRRLNPNEQIMFGRKECTFTPGGDVRTSPMYSRAPVTAQVKVLNEKLITRMVDEKWEQKEPISSMDDDRRNFVVEQCHKLKFAFNYYENRTVGSYPYTTGCGMNALNALIQGDDWGYYD